MDNLTFTVTKDDAGTLLPRFLKACAVSSTYIKAVKNTPEGICVNGVRRHMRHVLENGDVVTLPLLPSNEEFSAQPEDLPFDVIYESKFAIACEKPPYMAVHPTLSVKNGTLANGFSYYIAQKGKTLEFRPVYRLDKNTSGIVLLAMNSLSTPYLFKSSKKTYLAVVEGLPKEQEGTICEPTGLENGSIVKHCVRSDGKKSITHYKTLWSNGKISLVRLWLETGRTHQIRVHMAYIGHPLLGDDFYGGDCETLKRHALHCESLSFTEPDGNRVNLTSPLPKDICDILPKEALNLL